MNKKRVSLFKRVCASALLVLMILPFFCLPVLADDGTTLPKGYLDPYSFYTREGRMREGKPVLNYDIRHADGLYVSLVEVKSRVYETGIRMNNMHSDVKNPPPPAPMNFSPYSNQIWERDKDNGSFTITGSGSDPSGITYTYSVTFSNIRLGEYTINAGEVIADSSGYIRIDGIYDSTSETYTLETKDQKCLADITDDETVYYLRPYTIEDDGDVRNSSDLVFYFKVHGIRPIKSGNISFNQKAKDTSGEDEGVSVPAAVAIGITATGAAVAGALIAGASGAAGAAGSAGANTNPEKKNTPPPSSYKMYVQKDFGDSVRKDGKPVTIRARMAEINQAGSVLDRNDLTSQITASSEVLQIQGLSVVGRYLEATVIAPQDIKESEGSVTFTFTGLGGAFSNNVIFRLVDGPSLKFVEETSPGSGSFKTYNENTSFDMIPGDGFTYTDLFMIEDAPNPPELNDISVDPVQGFDITVEKTNYQSVYKLIVKNNTPEEKNEDVFAKPEEKMFQIHVLVEGEKEPLNGYVGINLYPEGLTASSREFAKKNDIKYVRVQAYEKEYVGALDKKWQVSEIKFTLAVKGKDKAIIDPKEMEFSFEKIKGGGGLGTRAGWEQSLADKYEYEESSGFYNDKFTYDFEPRITLMEPDDGTFFIVLLPVTCVYDGNKYTADVPLRLRGETPDPFEGWDEEYRKLKERVEKFSLPEDKDMWMEKLETVANDPRCTRRELRLLSKYIVRQYMQYWTIEGIKYRNDAEIYDTMVSQLEFIKFIGDCAFSFLVSAYAGPVAEALISPAKDFIAESAGEIVACWNYGTEIKVENFGFAKALESAGDNLVSNEISLTNWKKAAATLSAYFVYSAVKNYLKIWREKGESNLWGCLVDAFSDTTAQGLKAAAGELFTKWIKNNKKFQEKVGSEITKFFNKHLGRGRTINLKDQKIGNLQYDLNNALGLEGELRKLAGFQGETKNLKILKIDIIQKYLQEFVGKYAGWVSEDLDAGLDTTGTFAIGSDGHILFKFTLEFLDYGDKFLITIDFNRIVFALSTGIFGVLYQLLFDRVPCSVSLLTPPNDPPLPPPKEY